MSGFVGGVGVGSVIGGLLVVGSLLGGLLVVGSLLGGLVVGSSTGPASVGNMVFGGFEGVGADLGHVSSVAGTNSSCFIESVHERIK
jgi:hypothetical protein